MVVILIVSIPPIYIYIYIYTVKYDIRCHLHLLFIGTSFGWAQIDLFLHVWS